MDQLPTCSITLFEWTMSKLMDGWSAKLVASPITQVIRGEMEVCGNRFTTVTKMLRSFRSWSNAPQ